MILRMASLSRTQKIGAGIFLALVAIAIFFGCGVLVTPHKGNPSVTRVYWNAQEAKVAYAKNPNDPKAVRSMAVQASISHDRATEMAMLRKMQIVDPRDREMSWQLAYRLAHTGNERDAAEAVGIFYKLSRKHDGLGKNSAKWLNSLAAQHPQWASR